MDATVKLDLFQQGSRYDHYMELKETFATGVQILENALKVEDNTTSRQNLVKLTNAVALIEARVNYLTDFNQATSQFGSLAKEIRAIPVNRPAQLPEVSDSTRLECEEEMRKARENGYAEDTSAKNASTDKGTSTDNAK